LPDIEAIEMKLEFPVPVLTRVRLKPPLIYDVEKVLQN
jgi:hypothetical protein